MNDVNEANNVEGAEGNDELEQLNVGNSSNNVETRARRRRFSSQRTFGEDPLDNDVNNRQQQFELMIEDSDDDMDIEASDRLFEEYLKQNNSSTAENFNTELPTHHSYLGSMDAVSGLICFEVDKIYKIPISPHHSLIFPGEIVPMKIAESFFDETIFGADGNEGLVFGLIFLENTQKEKAKEIVYGVTCQVYERGVDDLGHITLLSRAHQRFQVIPQKDGSLTTSVQTDFHRKYYAHVKILPEIVLPDPIISLNSSNNLLKFLNNSSQYSKIKSRMAANGVWPKFVYDQVIIIIIIKSMKFLNRFFFSSMKLLA